MATTDVIIVTLEIDVDPDTWTLNYGVEGAAEIRKDVKTVVRSTVASELYRATGTGAEVKVR